MDGAGTVNRSYAKTGHWDGLDRSNYHLLPNSKVTKIELEGSKARGATFMPRNATASGSLSTTIKADKEVILAAGTMHSPLILQWSGIGPRGLLESAGIETKVYVHSAHKEWIAPRAQGMVGGVVVIVKVVSYTYFDKEIFQALGKISTTTTS